MVETVAAPVRVLISYAHDSADAAPGHQERVRRLWTFLRECGIDAQLDVLAANRQRDWTAWMDEQLRAARFVLVVASPAYKERATWQRDLAVSHNNLGNVAVMTGDKTAAAEHYQAALAITERLAATDPANVQWRQDLERLRERLH
jgi:hypothetical protein